MLDPVTLAVLKGRLEQIADEMDATLFRSAFNPIIAEAHDASHGLYDAKSGETLVQGKAGLPIFVGAMSFAVKAVIEKAARDATEHGEGIADGDVWLFNDPYDGGTHLSDFKLVRPFFRDGAIFCYLASVGHWHDVGGNVPGNYNPVATECFQEGMVIPPVRLFAGGVLRRDVVDIVMANSRQPNSLYGDLNGQINALDLGARRLGALLDDYGAATVSDAFTELRARAARLMRANIAELPDGTYSAEDFLDNDGIVDTPLKIALDLTISGETMTLDFSRSAAQCAGPVNIALSTTVASCYVALKHIFDDVPANAGVLEPIRFVVPTTSILHARAPKPVGGYTETILRIIDVVFVTLAEAVPSRVNGCAYGTINALSLAGHRRDGRRWVMFSFFGGGHGGHPEGDGLNHGNAPISTATIPPVEILEAAYPVMFTAWALRPDSGGPGRHRGGLGAIYEIELLEEQAEVFLFGERGKFAPPGVVGGGPGALNVFTYEQDDGMHHPPMDSKMVGIKISQRSAPAHRIAGRRRLRPARAARTRGDPPRYRPRLRDGGTCGARLWQAPRRMTKPHLIVGVDVGGTFTDVFFLDEASGTCSVAKVPSTRGNEAQGFREGIGKGARDLADIATIVHGTTAGTNALLERKGVRTGVIATAGFRDVLEMRRRDRPRTWGLWGQFEPVVPRDLRLEVAERTLADGTIREAVDIDSVRAAARELLANGAEAVSVIFINAYANPANERAAAAALRELWPNPYVNASSEILPEIREFERASTTAINAYLQPVVGTYLQRLEDSLAADGFAGEVLIVQSNGGVMTIETAKERPVRTALSGPAAGVIASAHIAASAGFPNVITCDMGGTSFDVSLIVGGKTVLAPQTSIGFGMVVRTPMIEITTIGAGGGSIAWVDRGGLLQIGPQSAGSSPGPVCYGAGNTEPTVTDANVVLGRINAARPIGGKLTGLDADAARQAIATRIAEPLGIETMAAAEAIIRVANSKMAGAIRLVSIERGHNPRDFVAMPFGGGGALHAGALIKDVGLAKAVVPRYPGVTSALGCVIADMRHDFVLTVNRLLGDLDLAALDAEIRAREAEGRALLARSGVSFTAIETLIELDMSYVGQTHTLAVPVALAGAPTAEALRHAFETRYRDAYGRLLDGIAIRLFNLRVAIVGYRPKLDLARLAPAPGTTIDDARRGRRATYVEGSWIEAEIFARLDLPAGARIVGPAILEQPDTTIFLEPDLEGEVDRFGNFVIGRREA